MDLLIKPARSWAWAAVLPLLLLMVLPLLIVLFLTVFLHGTHDEMESVLQGEASSAFPSYAQRYLPIYMDAGKKYGVPWNILAAIHKVETDFGRNLGVSSVGATGHMQFMDKTWVGWSYPGGTKHGDLPDTVDITDPELIRKYGGYGVDANGDGKADPNDPVDAIHTAAKYLAANKRNGVDWFAPNGPVWRYNHSSAYVATVKRFAESFVTLPVSLPSGWIFPVDGGVITSGYGMRPHPKLNVMRMHEGVDIAKHLGAPIRAVDSGRVVASREASGFGWMVVIDHGGGIQTLYGHMYPKDVTVKVGDTVEKGQVIARIGANGLGTGPHLHLEVLRNGISIDPMPFLKR